MRKDRIRRGLALGIMAMLLLAGCRPAASPEPAGESLPHSATCEQQEEAGQQEAKEESSRGEATNPESTNPEATNPGATNPETAEAPSRAREQETHLTLPVPPSVRPSLLLSQETRENLARETADGEAYWQPVDTMTILAAGQETELTVLDNSRYVREGTVYQAPPYDVAMFATLAAEALDHLYGISDFRSTQWSVLWSEDFHSLSFSTTDDPDQEACYWVNFQHGYLEEAVGIPVGERYISSMGVFYHDQDASSPLSQDSFLQPEELGRISPEEAARWYYEAYLLYPGPEAEEVQMTDYGTVEIYTVEGTAYYLELAEDNRFLNIYGPYQGRSGNQWENLP